MYFQCIAHLLKRLRHKRIIQGTAALGLWLLAIGTTYAEAPQYEPGSIQRSDEGRLAYYVRRAEGPWLVLIPGSWGDYRQFDDMVSRLSPHLQILVVEMRGCGESWPPTLEGSIELFAKDVLQVIDTLGIERCYVSGPSLGGMIAIEIAGQRPETVAGAIPIEGWTHHEVQKEAFGGNDAPTLTPDEDAEVARRRTQGQSRLTKEQRDHFGSIWTRWDGSSILAGTTVPVLEIWGDRGRPRPSRELMRIPERPNIELVWIPDASHSLLVEASPELAKTIDTFIKKCEATRQSEQAFTSEQAAAALHKAVAFFHEQVSTEGGYLWRYSADLSKREGEGKADSATVWVQPPGTPAVGQALLLAYRRTGDTFYLDAAKHAAQALVRGQLRSGGWDYRIHFDDRRAKFAYRQAPSNPDGAHTSTLDDNTTQAAVRFLMDVDKAMEFKDEPIHEAAQFALQALLDAQYPNGAWPQRFTGPPDPAKHPVKQASYPDTWSRTFPKSDYSGYYTFNDNTLGDTIELMFDATRTYRDERYKNAAVKAADFILLAQMPDPQPAWAQQYGPDMHPEWARKFEPPAITGGESQGLLRTLITAYMETGSEKYLNAAERALKFLRSSVLPDGSLARFYELRTNTPLYFTKDYQLTYSDADMPTHYGFKTRNNLGKIEEALSQARRGAAPGFSEKDPRMHDALTKDAQRAVESLDERGAWVESGRLRYHGDDDPTTRVIDTQTFIINVRNLADYIAASR